LMLDAYIGTIDYDGEVLDDARAEVAGWIRSGGRSLQHSFVALDGDTMASAILASIGDGVPLIAYAMTAASHKTRGLATALMEATMDSLGAAGYDRVELWVTIGNDPAEGIYERLGFRDVEADPA
ncbi:MAG TPA: GNAT family N-acetyltransferase, partial [Candidatus Limnocylindria bacterium]|nr:GNAT family N-acetyltransferase [Candidatus Limnocylindria bacterium]